MYVGPRDNTQRSTKAAKGAGPFITHAHSLTTHDILKQHRCSRGSPPRPFDRRRSHWLLARGPRKAGVADACSRGVRAPGLAPTCWIGRVVVGAVAVAGAHRRAARLPVIKETAGNRSAPPK
jgi:hypothetical protein